VMATVESLGADVCAALWAAKEAATVHARRMSEQRPPMRVGAPCKTGVRLPSPFICINGSVYVKE
jgi:hypothetical protein